MASRLRHTLAGLTQDPLHWTCSRNARLTGRKESDPLSRYAITADGGLVVTWPTAAADEAAVLTTLPAGPQSGQLALALTDLSEQLWRCYTHPATAAPDDDDLNSEQSRRRADRAAIELVPGIVGLTGPTGHEDDYAGFGRATYPAQAVAALLDHIDAPAAQAAVRAEIATELDAVKRADLGDLSGRAAQAVAYNRPDASPTQIAEAHRLLEADLFAAPDALRAVEPSAAAVAAATWLHAAARVAARAAGRESSLATVVRDADDIEALPLATPMHVLDRLEDGMDPHTIVIELVVEAQRVTDGQLGDLDRIAGEVRHALELADRLPPAHREQTLTALLDEIRACRLDPLRPGRDLLEDLLDGIRGCWLIFDEHHDRRTDLAVEDDDDITNEAAAAREAADQQAFEQAQASFAALVRSELAQLLP